MVHGQFVRLAGSDPCIGSMLAVEIQVRLLPGSKSDRLKTEETMSAKMKL